jgi:hypothetical protein
MKFRDSISPTLKPGLIINSVYPFKCSVELINPDHEYTRVFGWKCRILTVIERNHYQGRHSFVGSIESVFRHEFTDKNWKPYFKRPYKEDGTLV